MPLLIKHSFWLLLILSFLLLFPSLGKVPLWIVDEAKNAQCAREMWERSDWVVPTFNGALRVAKPPLHYYFMIIGFEIFGLNEWGARFFPALSGVLTLCTTYWFVARYSSKAHALVTGCVLLASTHFLFQMRLAVPDPFLIFFNALALFSAYGYFKEKRAAWLVVCALALGLGTLAKGPVAMVLPAVSIFFWLLWQKKLKALWHWHLLAAAVLVLLLAVPWYAAVHIATDGAWTKDFFFDNNINRFLEPMEGHGGLFILVPVFVLLGLLPASVFIAESLRPFQQRFTSSLMRLAFCVLITYIVFYSLSGTKLPNYPAPSYPFAAILLGHYILLGFKKNIVTKKYPFIILLVINIALPAGLYFAIKNETATRGLDGNAFVMGILTLAAITALVLYNRKGFGAALITLMGFYTLFNLIFFNYLYPVLYSNNPLSKSIAEVRKYNNVVAYKIFQPSFAFYLPRRIPVFEQADTLKAYLQNHPALVISRASLMPELDALVLQKVAAHHDLFENNTTVLYTNVKR